MKKRRGLGQGKKTKCKDIRAREVKRIARNKCMFGYIVNERNGMVWNETHLGRLGYIIRKI